MNRSALNFKTIKVLKVSFFHRKLLNGRTARRQGWMFHVRLLIGLARPIIGSCNISIVNCLSVMCWLLHLAQHCELSGKECLRTLFVIYSLHWIYFRHLSSLMSKIFAINYMAKI